MSPNFHRVTKQMLIRIISRTSPFYVDGKWTCPESAICAAVIYEWAEELRTLAMTVYKDSGGFVMHHVVNRDLDAIKYWCELINIDSDFPKKILDDMEICGRKP